VELAILQSTKRAAARAHPPSARGHNMRCDTSSLSNLTTGSQHQSGSVDGTLSIRLGTLLGTLAAFFHRSVQKTEEKHGKGDVFWTVVSSKKHRQSGTSAVTLIRYDRRHSSPRNPSEVESNCVPGDEDYRRRP
jgi:hypothetical protein